jgi:hypothetical protein
MNRTTQSAASPRLNRKNRVPTEDRFERTGEGVNGNRIFACVGLLFKGNAPRFMK